MNGWLKWILFALLALVVASVSAGSGIVPAAGAITGVAVVIILFGFVLLLGNFLSRRS